MVATLMRGSSAGAKAGNQASGSGVPVSAVPYLPATGMPKPAKAAVAVPYGSVDHRLHRIGHVVKVPGLTADLVRHGRLVRLDHGAVRQRGGRQMRGVHSFPPLPMAA